LQGIEVILASIRKTGDISIKSGTTIISFIDPLVAQ